MSKKLYVGNLLYEVEDDQLRDIFSQFGNVVSAQVIKYRDTGRSKGFGFVEFESEESAQQAIDALNGQDHNGRKLVVSEARPVQPREFGDRGGDRGPRRNGGGYGGGNRGGYGQGNRDGNRGYNDQGGSDDDMGM